ncbi:hypothetical protein WI665_07530 [Vibrio cholerae]
MTRTIKRRGKSRSLTAFKYEVARLPVAVLRGDERAGDKPVTDSGHLGMTGYPVLIDVGTEFVIVLAPPSRRGGLDVTNAMGASHDDVDADLSTKADGQMVVFDVCVLYSNVGRPHLFRHASDEAGCAADAGPENGDTCAFTGRVDADLVPNAVVMRCAITCGESSGDP